MANRGKYSRVEKGKLEKLVREFPRRVDQFGRKAAAAMTGEVVTSFGSGPPGRTYQKYNPRRTHTASSPGNPPNSDTGTLVGSINWATVGRFKYWVYAGTDYAVILEFGSQNSGGNLAPRPFITPVFQRWLAGELVRFARQEGLFKV